MTVIMIGIYGTSLQLIVTWVDNMCCDKKSVKTPNFSFRETL